MKKTKQLTIAGAVEAMLQHRAVYGVVSLEPGNVFVSDLEEYEMFFEYEEVEPEPEKPVSAIVEKEAKKAGRPKKVGKDSKDRIDDGKIRALFEAGWNLSSIALEAGCSAQTVRSHLETMGLLEVRSQDVVEKTE